MKKQNDLGGLVYSTNPDLVIQAEKQQVTTLAPSAQNLRVQLDKKQRKGKKVTLITGFIGKQDDLSSLGKSLQNKCGTGGSVKQACILLQGDFREQAMVYLLKAGFKVKQIGG